MSTWFLTRSIIGWRLCSVDSHSLWPHLSELIVEHIERKVDEVVVSARVRGHRARCRHCGKYSGRVHGRYDRTLADAPVAGAGVVVVLQVRRFRCTNGKCAAVTFTEQVPGVTTPHSRATPLWQDMVARIGLALAGRAGARLAAAIGINCGRDTILRRVRAPPDPPRGEVTVAGVDDFALRYVRAHVPPPPASAGTTSTTSSTAVWECWSAHDD
ncbi:transposase family protein [Prauserella flavalba]|uniref:transposase family protein n=1 Tax=Prauserella flavalba TaxID=1477506 RepID=UPI00319EA06D